MLKLHSPIFKIIHKIWKGKLYIKLIFFYKMPTKKKRKQGKLNRAAGARFELKVRNLLESDGWIVDKWTNNVDLEEKKLIKAKRKFNPYRKVLGIGTGFPDFIAFRKKGKSYEVIGVEVKGNGWLDKSEKEKCRFLLKEGIFKKILVVKKGKKRGEIEKLDFKKKYS